MVSASFHPREAARLRALQSCGVLDTASDPGFDGLTVLAARLCDAPIALISLVDKDRQWFKARHNFAPAETPRDGAFCAHTILQREPLIVPDTQSDERFAENPRCLGKDAIRFYAGVPLLSGDGLPLGTICVLDHSPRPQGLSPAQVTDLQLLGGQAQKLLELERSIRSAETALKESVHRIQNVVAVASAIAARTIAEADSLDVARRKLMDRLLALSRAQGFLLDASKGGASLRELIEKQLIAFGDDDPRFSLRGIEISVDGVAAEGIGLAVHELATNAIKYGALSVPSGRVDIQWERKNDGGVALEWRESGGPEPLQDGVEKGFGTVVVGDLAAQKIGGGTTFELLPSGALWTADVAASRVTSLA